MDKTYPCQHISIPYKKLKRYLLMNQQKELNKKFVSERVLIEHSISGLKRFRLHRIDLYDQILGICAALWNFYLA